ncbi:secondary thiamine-phosphate synthase enzyme YjbQ [Marinobacter segnicrescens]|uniref:Secondary thiamine-phosphate synthase enzyme n=1 Tax=Marinobacter segnicrescens TaxID=430453 RepID=A0A1I0B5S1_9GAMM|nr:secondary thiamine-phosphate synthase enzyme YjbQ [Marinobacter segnicrescens]SET01860.1 secondary thiamine-phosphate synthase enzyme [Marinobacter segnicrescens]
MIWDQTTIQLQEYPRGVHLITNDVLANGPELVNCQVGLLHLFIQHTSASLAINENADPDVRGDIERHLNVMVPENASHYEHTLEGPDDMPAHIKSILIGPSLTIPVSGGHLALGTWQGIYLCEHRNRGGGRRIVATLQGRW